MKVGEAGVTVVIGTSYSLAAKTALTITLLDPSGNASTIADGSITITASPYDGGTLGTFGSNTYAQFDTTTTTFDEAGTWTGYLKYEDGTKTLYSDTFSITVEAVP